MDYQNKTSFVRAHQWHKNGDHPSDNSFSGGTADDGVEGGIVRYYRHPFLLGHSECAHCGHILHNHGWIDSAGRGQVVCPGDYVVRGANGGWNAISQKAFAALFLSLPD